MSGTSDGKISDGKILKLKIHYSSGQNLVKKQFVCQNSEKNRIFQEQVMAKFCGVAHVVQIAPTTCATNSVLPVSGTMSITGV